MDRPQKNAHAPKSLPAVSSPGLGVSRGEGASGLRKLAAHNTASGAAATAQSSTTKSRGKLTKALAYSKSSSFGDDIAAATSSDSGACPSPNQKEDKVDSALRLRLDPRAIEASMASHCTYKPPSASAAVARKLKERPASAAVSRHRQGQRRASTGCSPTHMHRSAGLIHKGSAKNLFAQRQRKRRSTISGGAAGAIAAASRPNTAECRGNFLKFAKKAGDFKIGDFTGLYSGPSVVGNKPKLEPVKGGRKGSSVDAAAPAAPAASMRFAFARDWRGRHPNAGMSPINASLRRKATERGVALTESSPNGGGGGKQQQQRKSCSASDLNRGQHQPAGMRFAKSKTVLSTPNAGWSPVNAKLRRKAMNSREGGDRAGTMPTLKMNFTKKLDFSTPNAGWSPVDARRKRPMVGGNFMRFA